MFATLAAQFPPSEEPPPELRSILERIEEIYGTASATTSMCESFVVIDKRIEQYRQLLRSTADFLEKGRINRLIMELYAERVVARSYLPEEASRDPAAIKAAVEGLMADVVFELDAERADRNKRGKRVTHSRP